MLSEWWEAMSEARSDASWALRTCHSAPASPGGWRHPPFGAGGSKTSPGQHLRSGAPRSTLFEFLAIASLTGYLSQQNHSGVDVSAFQNPKFSPQGRAWTLRLPDLENGQRGSELPTSCSRESAGQGHLVPRHGLPQLPRALCNSWCSQLGLLQD